MAVAVVDGQEVPMRLNTASAVDNRNTYTVAVPYERAMKVSQYRLSGRQWIRHRFQQLLASFRKQNAHWDMAFS